MQNIKCRFECEKITTFRDFMKAITLLNQFDEVL